jgi:hypothetical protein
VNNPESADKNKLGFNQLAAVFHVPVFKPNGHDINRGVLGLNFGIGYNKTKNYNSDVTYGGVNTTSSFADYLADLSDYYLSGGNPEIDLTVLPTGTLERMAYNNFLTEYHPDGYFPTTAPDGMQQNITFFTGSQSELSFAAAANISNQLYLGASVSFSSLNFGADREFLESGQTRAYSGQPAELAGASYTLSYRSNQTTEGSGFNAKLGLIYHAYPFFRLGFSFITPTWYSIDDHFAEALDTRYVQANQTSIPAYLNDPESYDSNYTLRTPYRVNGGVSFVFAGIGLISGDLEYVDYSTIKFTASGDKITTDNMNREIVRNYAQALNKRIGGEIKATDYLMLRAGANFIGNPYKTGDFDSRTLSAGLGYRKNNFYTDFTYTQSDTRSYSRPYSISAGYPDFDVTGVGEEARLNDRQNNFYLTFGVRF